MTPERGRASTVMMVTIMMVLRSAAAPEPQKLHVHVTWAPDRNANIERAARVVGRTDRPEYPSLPASFPLPILVLVVIEPVSLLVARLFFILLSQFSSSLTRIPFPYHLCQS